MKVLGKIFSNTDTTIIIKSNITPKLGEKVFDSKNREIGIVRGILGPIKTPYISIKTIKKLMKNNEKLYIR